MTRTFAADQIRLNAVQLIQGTADPSSGGGVVAAIGSAYFRSGTGQWWNKTTAANTGWEKLVQSLGWLSVKDFGARGDNSTDDTASVQAAIDAAATAGGNVVYFPPGTYRCSQLAINAQNNVQLVGCGAGSIIRWTWNAATAAGSLLTITASSRTVVSSLTFSGAGLTNPAASRKNHLIAIAGASVETRIVDCRFTGMVAASGDGVNVLGTAGNLPSRTWVVDNAFDGCSRFGCGVGEALEYIWIVQNYFTNNEVDIGLVAATDLNTNGVSIVGNEIVHVSSTRHAVRIEGAATALATNVVYANNIVINGFATLAQVENCVYDGNVFTSGTFASADSVLRVFGTVTDTVITNLLLGRASTASVGACITVEKSTGTPTRVRLANLSLLNETVGGGFVIMTDVLNCSLGSGTFWSSDADTSTMFGVDIQAVTQAVSGIQVGPGINILADAGSLAAAVRLLCDGSDMGAVAIWGNTADPIDYGVQYEIDGGGSFTTVPFTTGNNFPGSAGDYNDVGVTIRPRIGLNASTTGQQYFAGAGTPEGNVTATTGSLYSRSDGGQGTTVYYKESGVSNTGWLGIGGSPIVFGAGDLTTVATAVYFAPGWIATATATEVSMAVTRPGTIRNLRVEVKTAGTDADLVTYTVRKNGVDTTLTCSRANDSAGSASDTTHSFTVVAGDLISIKATKANPVTAGAQNTTATVELA